MPSWQVLWTPTCHGTSTHRRPPQTPSPEAIFDGVENGDEEIFPDPASETLAESWRSGAVKVLEREYATLVDAAATA